MTTDLLGVGLVLLGTLIGALGPIFMKKGAEKFTINPIKILKNPLIILKNYNAIIGCGLFGFSAIFFVWGLRHGELSVLYPITSVTYIWTCLWSTKMLNEKMNRSKWIGIAWILLGVVLIGLGRA